VILRTTISLSWLRNTFQSFSENTTNDIIAQYTRTHILSLIENMSIVTAFDVFVIICLPK